MAEKNPAGDEVEYGYASLRTPKSTTASTAKPTAVPIRTARQTLDLFELQEEAVNKNRFEWERKNSERKKKLGVTLNSWCVNVIILIFCAIFRSEKGWKVYQFLCRGEAISKQKRKLPSASSSLSSWTETSEEVEFWCILELLCSVFWNSLF